MSQIGGGIRSQRLYARAVSTLTSQATGMHPQAHVI
jgi:hypothetical protein